MFRGVGPTLAGAVVYEGIKFGMFDHYLELLTDLQTEVRHSRPRPSP